MGIIDRLSVTVNYASSSSVGPKVNEVEPRATFTILKADSAALGDAGHLHSVSLTEADLDSINAGNTVSKTTTNVSGHTHTFDFRRT